MSRQQTEYPEWSRLPIPLQHQYFSHSRDEALACKRKLVEQGEKLKQFQESLEFKQILQDDQWKKWRIACVDGSYSPATSERIGARYGVYCGGYMIFEDEELVDEGYRSGKLSQDQVGDPELTKQTLDILCTKLEREIAYYCLQKEDVDLLLIDGSFFGFRAGLRGIRKEEIGLDGFKTVGDLADYTTNLSIKLMRSGKVAAIIKRVRTTAFDGWLIYRHGNEEQCIRRNDRAILASLMPQNYWFAYEWLLGSPEAFNYLTWLRTDYRRLPGRSMDSILRHCKRTIDYGIERDLNCVASDILQTSRYYVRCVNSAPPFCFETHRDVDVKPLLAYFQANHNPVTGLPFPIDLIDQNVSLPRGFTKEFVEEVEALLIRDRELDRLDLSNYFMYINPQKEE